MTEIQQNRYDRLVRRVANVVGGGSQVNDTLNELFPIIDVENVPGELLLLSGTRLCFGTADITGGAGLAPQIALSNPDDSGTLIAVSSVVVSHTPTSTILYAISAGPLPTLLNTQRFRDTRLPLADLPTGQISHTSAAGFLSAAGSFIIANNERLVLDDENTIAVLAPGTALVFGSSTLTGRLVITFNWRERTAEPAELNL